MLTYKDHRYVCSARSSSCSPSKSGKVRLTVTPWFYDVTCDTGTIVKPVLAADQIPLSGLIDSRRENQPFGLHRNRSYSKYIRSQGPFICI